MQAVMWSKLYERYTEKLNGHVDQELTEIFNTKISTFLVSKHGTKFIQLWVVRFLPKKICKYSGLRKDY